MNVRRDTLAQCLRRNRFRGTNITTYTLCAVLFLCVCLSTVQNTGRLTDNFSTDREEWQSYDFTGGIAGGGNVFFPVTWEKSGGVNNSGHVWTDDSRWRIDTPENPHSILALIHYPRWVKGDRLDLRNAKVSVYLRGDGLDLKGAKCFFWAVSAKGRKKSRWHYTSRPLKANHGHWGDKQTFLLKNDESLWHRSWSRDASKPVSLDYLLGNTDSYGFSFLGFSGEVTGKVSMDELEIELAGR